MQGKLLTSFAFVVAAVACGGGSSGSQPTTATNATPVPPASASPADPHDAALAAFEKDVAQAIVKAASGQPVDAKWVAKNPKNSVATLTDEDKKLLAVVGPSLTIELVEMEVGEMAQPNAGEHHQMNARAILLPDNTIRWGTVGSRKDESHLQEPTPGLAKSAPAVVEAGSRLMTALGSSCQMPWLAPSDVAKVQPSIQNEFIADMAATKAACAQAAGVKGEWRTHIDDLRVLVAGNGHHAILNAVFDVEDPEAAEPHLVLGPLHIEIVSDKK